MIVPRRRLVGEIRIAVWESAGPHLVVTVEDSLRGETLGASAAKYLAELQGCGELADEALGAPVRGLVSHRADGGRLPTVEGDT